jgi:hypothetical protein
MMDLAPQVLQAAAQWAAVTAAEQAAVEQVVVEQAVVELTVAVLIQAEQLARLWTPCLILFCRLWRVPR